MLPLLLKKALRGRLGMIGGTVLEGIIV